MQFVILFGGGDGGGLVLTPHGVKRIPPWEPRILAALKTITAASRLQTMAAGDPVVEHLGEFSTRALAEVLPKIEETVGDLHGEAGLVVLGDDGDGWYCGTVPRKPIPLPPGPGWPLLLSRLGRVDHLAEIDIPG